MNTRTTLLIVIVVVAVIGVWYWSGRTPASPTATAPQASGYKNISYTIDGQAVALVNGSSTVPVAPGSASNVVTQYFGNEAVGDLNNDGVPDVAFILTQNSGGSGTFYYVVAAFQTASGYQGTNGVLLGDRISPQTTQIEDGQVVVNYADRGPNDAMTVQPSIGVSKYLKISNGSLVEIPSSEYAAGNLLLGSSQKNSVGTYLIGSNGMTLYTYSKDTSGVSQCSGACADAWPPYTVGTTSVLANLQSGITGKAGILMRADNTMQVTYNGLPLYYYKLDTKSGDSKGDGVANMWKTAKP